jgi:hypothetical protein
MSNERIIAGGDADAWSDNALTEELCLEGAERFEDEGFARRITSYLLGELSEEESEQVEDECFAGDYWPAQVRFIEEDLIEAYLRDELSPEQRQRFEQNYLTTSARQARVRAAELLLHVAERSPVVKDAGAAMESERNWFERLRLYWGSLPWVPRVAYALAATTAVAATVGALWVLLTPRPQTFATLTLEISNSTRAQGAQAETVNLPPDADALIIYLTLPDRLQPAAGFRAEVERAGGESFSFEPEQRDARTVSVSIPAESLSRGQYALRLFTVGAEGSRQRVSGNYFFNVE